MLTSPFFHVISMPTPFDPSVLNHFTGTGKYYRIFPKFLITDGVKYLADNAECYWLIDAIFSHLTILGNSDWFVMARLKVNGSKAVLTLEDGNGTIRVQQKIPYTDFPMPEQVLYVCWDGQYWVLMLPSEY